MHPYFPAGLPGSAFELISFVSCFVVDSSPVVYSLSHCLLRSQLSIMSDQVPNCIEVMDAIHKKMERQDIPDTIWGKLTHGGLTVESLARIVPYLRDIKRLVDLGSGEGWCVSSLLACQLQRYIPLEILTLSILSGLPCHLRPSAMRCSASRCTAPPSLPLT